MYFYQIFSRESNSTFTNVHSFVCQSVCKTPLHLEIIILHQHSSFIIHNSSFIIFQSVFIILQSSFLHFATFKLFSLFDARSGACHECAIMLVCQRRQATDTRACVFLPKCQDHVVTTFWTLQLPFSSVLR